MLIEPIQDELTLLKKDFLFRSLKTLQSAQDAVITIDGKKVINFCSNNYLGLANHPKLKEASVWAIRKFGTSASASRLISGNNILYKELEEKIAAFKKTESAVVFSSGYAANLGAIQAFLAKGDFIFSDRLNHASIIDGAILSRAKILRYPHRDTLKLEEFLGSLLEGNRRKLIVTDSLFSMDGDIAPLKELNNLARKHSSFFMVDEAHATGIFGKSGSGLLEEFGIEDPNIIQMGTFSKSLGSLGGYIAAKKEIIDYLINKSRSLIYTTALPPSVLASSIASLELIKDKALRERLWDNIKFFKKNLSTLKFDTGDSNSQIIPIILKDSKLSLKFSEGLFREGVFAHAIRPPTVPVGTARIRISIMASHKKENLVFGLDKIEKVGKELKVI